MSWACDCIIYWARSAASADNVAMCQSCLACTGDVVGGHSCFMGRCATSAEVCAQHSTNTTDKTLCSVRTLAVHALHTCLSVLQHEHWRFNTADENSLHRSLQQHIPMLLIETVFADSNQLDTLLSCVAGTAGVCRAAEQEWRYTLSSSNKPCSKAVLPEGPAALPEATLCCTCCTGCMHMVLLQLGQLLRLLQRLQQAVLLICASQHACKNMQT